MATPKPIVTIDLDMTKLIFITAGLTAKVMLVLDKGAFDIERTAKILAPVITGALKASIYTHGASGGSNYGQNAASAKSKNNKAIINDVVPAANIFERVVGVSVNYGIFPEVQGRAYLVPAVEQHRAAITGAFGQLF